MKEPIKLGETPIDVSVTIGLNEATNAAPTLDIEIVDRAIVSIEQARRNRRPVACFDAVLLGDPASELTLMSEMQHALDSDAMSLHYQPILDLRTNSIIGVEALVRWRHPQRGPLAPDVFLPMAEETGRIAALTEWVLTRAVDDQRRLLKLGHTLSFSVNLSGCLVDNADFAKTILTIAGDAVGRIILEVTETAIIGNPEVAHQTLRSFKAAGLGISIDDYGSGLSSLSYLKNIPADELKVDKVFVLNLATDHTDEMLVRAADRSRPQPRAESRRRGDRNRGGARHCWRRWAAIWPGVLHRATDAVRGLTESPPPTADRVGATLRINGNSLIPCGPGDAAKHDRNSAQDRERLGATRSSMLLATPGVRLMRPPRSRVSTIW